MITHLLEDNDKFNRQTNTTEIRDKLLHLLKKVGIKASFHSAEIGSTITRYSFSVPIDTNLNKFRDLQDNVKLLLSVSQVRILSPVPSRPFVGIEVPNAQRETVKLKSVLKQEFKTGKNLPVALGTDIIGKPIVTDLAKLPHVLIAGATGSGKSVCVNSLIVSLINYLTPDQVKFIMIDPKIVELSVYDDIPYLLYPVITDVRKAITVLNNLVKIMHDRYNLLKKNKVRNIEGYNKLSEKKLEYIVVVIDEFADLVMVAKKEIEETLSTLSAMARAVGIHLVLATQRPSVDVITGVIKNNFPSRIAFRVPSNIDSRVILDEAGAETLLGKGDSLYKEPSYDNPKRIQGAFLSDEEVTRIVKYLCETMESCQFNEVQDDLYEKARELVYTSGRYTAGYIQRNLFVPYEKAKELIDKIINENKDIQIGVNHIRQNLF